MMSKGKASGNSPQIRGGAIGKPFKVEPQKRGADPAKLMRIGRAIRAQKTRQDLVFHLANALPQHLSAEQSIVFAWKGADCRALAASNVPRPNPDSAWVQSVSAACLAIPPSSRSAPNRVKLQQRANDAASLLPFGLYLPLKETPRGTPEFVVLARSRAWSEAEIDEAQYLAESYAHALQRSDQGPSAWRRVARRGLGWISALVVIGALVFVKIPSFAVAPARVTASTPVAIAPAIAGSVKDIWVEAGQDIRAGTLLISLDDSVAAASLASAKQALIVAEIREAQLRNTALRQPNSRAELLLAEAEVAQARIDVQEAEMTLGFHHLKAPRDGRVIGERLERLLGRPVTFGDVILTLADPSDLHVSADVAVSDSGFVFAPTGARFFGNDAPFSPKTLRVKRTPAAPEQDARGGISYPVQLAFADTPNGGADLVAGAEGIVQLTGPKAPLGFVILRKPLTWVAQRLPQSITNWLMGPAQNG